MKIHNNYRLTSIICISLVLTINLLGANHYIDKNATGNNNGTNWSNAWESFSNINWGIINPGDIIYISGGNDSTFYYETLSIQKSGTSENPILITKGIENGHNGKVIIDGQNTLTYCVNFGNSEYVILDHLYLSYATVGNIRLRANNNIVQYCNFFIHKATFGIDLRASNCKIVHNTATTSSDTSGGQRDFIQSTAGGNNEYAYNYIRIMNEKSSDHTDCFQFYGMTGDCVLHDNFIWQDNHKTNNAQGIYMTTSNIRLTCYNNIIYFPYAKHGLSINNTGGYSGTMTAYNNTLYGGAGSVESQMWFQNGVNNLILKNNISYSANPNVVPLFLGVATSGSIIDFNLLYNGSSIVVYEGSGKTWSQWQSMGNDLHGFNSNPLFNNIANLDFTVKNNSNAVDNGISLNPPFNIDHNGIIRPYGIAFDMGAFEFDDLIPDVTPPDVTGASISNTTTVIVNFSEALDQASAENPSNYCIDNGITVNSALLSTDNSKVTLTTGPHNFNQQYIVTVNNIKDISGNLINPQANSAAYLLEGDTTPPEVTGAYLTDATTLIINFSESLEQSGAENTANYNINNGITLSNAALSNDGKNVTLTTSTHTSGQNYLVTVNNIEDLAGNVISPQADTAGYSYYVDTIPPELLKADLSGTKTVFVTFSEVLDQTSAEDINNYSIDNGITIHSATLQACGTIVSLFTSQHVQGIVYTLRANNIKDPAGNIISQESNTYQYQKVNGGGGKHRVNPNKALAQWYQNFIPENTIDGIYNPTSESRWAGILPMPDSIRFELNEITMIEETHFSFYRWDQGRIYHFSVQTSVDDMHWTEILTDITSDASEWTINQFDPVIAKYVKLICINSNESNFAGLWEAEFYGPDQSTEINPKPIISSDFKLEQNYPNPFNPATTIRFNLPSDQHVKINIYNVVGEMVKELVNENYSAGTHSIEFNGSRLSSGIYIYRIETLAFTDIKKMVLLK